LLTLCSGWQTQTTLCLAGHAAAAAAAAVLLPIACTVDVAHFGAAYKVVSDMTKW
jgi:hypothetical protein